jgi:hypothetical protein
MRLFRFFWRDSDQCNRGALVVAANECAAKKQLERWESVVEYTAIIEISLDEEGVLWS